MIINPPIVQSHNTISKNMIVTVTVNENVIAEVINDGQQMMFTIRATKGTNVRIYMNNTITNYLSNSGNLIFSTPIPQNTNEAEISTEKEDFILTW